MVLSAIRDKIRANWEQYALYAGFLAALALLLAYRLGTLLPGLSANEVATLQHANLHYIVDVPVNAPYLLFVKGLSFLNGDYLLWGRIASALCGVLTLVLFGGLAWYWHGRREAALGTILFATSAWFLHTARWGTPDVVLFFILALIACYLWLHKTSSSWALLTAFILVALSLYTPGMVWFIVAGVIWRWRSIDRAFKKNLWAVSVGAFVLLAALVPLALAAYHHHFDVLKVLAGLPAAGWPHPSTVLHTLALIPFHIFVQGPVNAERWLGDVAIVDVFTTAMFFLGGYLYIRHLKLKRVQLCVGALALGAILASLGGGVTITLLLPFIYIIAAAGIGFMIDRWLEVFPRNTIAQGAGYLLIGLAMLSACAYSMAHYYSAWPQAKATRLVYTQHQLPKF